MLDENQERIDTTEENEKDIDSLREHLSEGGFGSSTVMDEEEIDQTPDDSVVSSFIEQFNAEGETPLKAHDWKVYMPSRMCSPDFWGPLFGIIREETESVYVFDSPIFEDEKYVIGYIDNASYSSQKLANSFYHDVLRLIGFYADGKLHMSLRVNNAQIMPRAEYNTTINAIAALKKQYEACAGDIEILPDYSVRNPAEPLSTDPLANETHDAIEALKKQLAGDGEATATGFKPVDRTYTPSEYEYRPVRVKQYDTVTNLFSRNTGLLESSIMLDKRAVLVGCGSVGSFVAMELARSGVGKFVLCDTDTLEIHNICRHQCGYNDLGRYKVDAVKDKILNINPNAEVITYRTMIQRVPEEELLPLLGRDTIIIGGGDNRASADWACKLAIKTDSTFVATCCWTRAFAGEIFYWASGKELSCYSCALGGLIDSERPESHATYFGSDDDKDKLAFEPGVAVDIDFVTIIAVKLALDLLNRDNPDYTPRVINDLRQYTWVCNTNSPRIGGERAGIFSHPLQITRNLKVHRDENCPYCGTK